MQLPEHFVCVNIILEVHSFPLLSNFTPVRGFLYILHHALAKYSHCKTIKAFYG